VFVVISSRLIPSPLSDSLPLRLSRERRENPPSLEPGPRSLLSPSPPLLLIPSLPVRSGLPVEVGTEVFLSLIELPEREGLSELIRLLVLPSSGRATRELDSLVLTLLPMRDDLIELKRLLELSICGRVTLEVDPLVLTLLLISKLLLDLIRLLKLPV
jgi:hypothetical protein